MPRLKPRPAIIQDQYKLDAITSDECRQQIVDWLRQIASKLYYQSEAATLKKVKLIIRAQSEAYDEAADWIMSMEIVKPDKKDLDSLL